MLRVNRKISTQYRPILDRIRELAVEYGFEPGENLDAWTMNPHKRTIDGSVEIECDAFRPRYLVTPEGTMIILCGGIDGNRRQLYRRMREEFGLQETLPLRGLPGHDDDLPTDLGADMCSAGPVARITKIPRAQVQ